MIPTKTIHDVKIIKLPDDPLALRISIGGTKEVGYYLVYRGEINKIKKCLSTCYKSLKQYKKSLLTKEQTGQS